MYHVECYADEHLVKKLTGNTIKISHHNDKGRVVSRIKKEHGHIALIDEDPFQVQPEYLKSTRLVEEKHDIIIKEDAKSNRFVILCPRLEDWLQKALKKSNKELGDYFSEKKPQYVHAIIHHQKDKLSSLIDDMISENNVFFKTLENALKK